MARTPTRRRIVLALVGVLTTGAAVACGGGSGGDGGGGSDSIRIGVIGPLSGQLAFGGEDHLRGYELAAAEVNEAGGVNGRTVELVPGDASTPEQGITEVRRLATQEAVDAFIGTYSSGVAATASEAAARYDKVYWETNALANELTERGLENFVRSGMSANAFGDAAGDFLPVVAEQLGKPIGDLTVYIEHEDSIYGTSIAERQVAALEAAGAQVAGNAAHSAAATDLTGSVLQAQQAAADVWLVTGYPTDTTLLMNTAASQGFRPPAIVLTGVGDTADTRDALPAEFLEGILVVGYARPDISEEYGPGSSTYIDAYRESYGEDFRTAPGFTAFAGMKLFLQVLGEADSLAPADVRAAAAELDEPVNTQPNGWGVQFDENFQNTRAVPTVIQWQGGQQVTVYPEEAGAGQGIVGLPLS